MFLPTCLCFHILVLSSLRSLCRYLLLQFCIILYPPSSLDLRQLSLSTGSCVCVGSLTIPRLLAAAETEQRYVTIVLDGTLSASWLALLVETASFGFTMESTIAAPVYPPTHSQFTEAAVFRCVLHAHLLLSPFSIKSLYNYPHS